ncbi:hypothetical protein [Bradyrhizobium sp. Ghvi]|uniref:hypothetical protein n=1 Tax=Bradyrhizobium sp. Ghvi TaxID=1855319 RepID=UPI001177F3D9|nr:hypothetical protein [Bradyrhizobium sp. Ghvi]
MIIVVVAIMPHAQERSKRKRDALRTAALCFPQNGMVRDGLDICTSLRAQERNPESHCGKNLNCVAALAGGVGNAFATLYT